MRRVNTRYAAFPPWAMNLFEKLRHKHAGPGTLPVSAGVPAAQTRDVPGTNAKLAIIFGPGAGGKEAIHWISYGAARAKYVSEHFELYQGQSGLVVPTFAEEVEARTAMAGLEKSQPQASSPYFSDLLKVCQANYMEEYVWLFLSRPTWPEADRPKRMPAFITWAKTNLAKHAPETHGWIRLDREGAPGQATAVSASVDVKNGGGGELEQLTRDAAAAFQQGEKAKAAQSLQDIRCAARALQNEPGASYLAFQNQAEFDFFLGGHPEVRSVRVVLWCVAQALYLGAFIASQGQQFEEALSRLEELICLAPLMARAHREKAYVLTRLGRTREAFAAFSHTWDLATRLPNNASEAGAALRGMAVALIEMKELDRAGKLLIDSLVIEPESRVAKNELAYIAQTRQGRSRGGAPISSV